MALLKSELLALDFIDFQLFFLSNFNEYKR